MSSRSTLQRWWLRTSALCSPGLTIWCLWQQRQRSSLLSRLKPLLPCTCPWVHRGHHCACIRGILLLCYVHCHGCVSDRSLHVSACQFSRHLASLKLIAAQAVAQPGSSPPEATPFVPPRYQGAVWRKCALCCAAASVSAAASCILITKSLQAWWHMDKSQGG